MTRVLIVEDSKITRDSLLWQISASDEFEVVAQIENAANAEIACIKGNVDLILMDVCTAYDESGFVAASKIKKSFPKIKIIIMTSMPEYSFIRKAHESGCDSFWYKEYGDVELLDICRRTMNGEALWPDETPTVQVGLIDSKKLTEREFQVMRELAKGHKYYEIAYELNISENTVKYHVNNILRKTGYRNATALVSDIVAKRLVLPRY